MEYRKLLSYATSCDCDNSNIAVGRTDCSGNTIHCICMSCYKTGPDASNSREAINLWNKKYSNIKIIIPK
jgi:hypothetical protein